MTTFTPEKPEAASPALNGKADDALTEKPTIIEFEAPTKKRLPLFELPPQRWGLIAGVVGGSIALATTATVVANGIARRRSEPRRIFGVRPVQRYGVRHLQIPRGGVAWLAYLYRTPDLRLRLPTYR
jgi:hypothetical protein